MTDVDALAATLRGYRFTFATEDDLQAGIAGALEEAGIDAQREVILDDRSRIDLLAAGVGIEVKVGGNGQACARQLRRYAEHEAVEALLLVTSRVRHVRHVPPMLNGKPVRVVAITNL